MLALHPFFLLQVQLSSSNVLVPKIQVSQRDSMLAQHAETGMSVHSFTVLEIGSLKLRDQLGSRRFQIPNQNFHMSSSTQGKLHLSGYSVFIRVLLRILSKSLLHCMSPNNRMFMAGLYSNLI